MNGIVVIDKPPLFTSHDIVNFIRRRFKLRKVGHAGTLDPLATGVLIILLGSFTKKSIEFTNTDKEYIGTVSLGVETDSGDAQGRIICTKNVDNFNQGQVEIIFSQFMGEITQVPPMVSSLKHKGQPLYKFARQGITVKRKPRKIMISSLQITRISPPEIDFRITCSKGTYLRQLAIDIGKKFGCGAHLAKLRRIRSGALSLDKAISWEQLQKIERLDDFLCR